MSDKRTMLHITLDSDMKNELEKEAKGKRLSLSSFCRMALADLLRQLKTSSQDGVNK